MAKPRVLYVTLNYPLLCETYIHTEIRALRDDYDIRVAAMRPVQDERVRIPDPVPFEVIQSPEHIGLLVESFRPQVLHCHWMAMSTTLHDLAKHFGIPYTIRAHSTDTLPNPPRNGFAEHWHKRAPKWVPKIAADEHLLGVLAFPFSRPLLTRWGLRDDQITDCFPVVDVARFHDTGPNAPGILNVGSCLPKKAMGDYIQMAQQSDRRPFDMQPVSYASPALLDHNDSLGRPATINEPVPYEQMPAVYKAHDWLVYTGSFENRCIGWPMAVAEAQASGCGVIVANVRPDIATYVGEGGGFLYDSVEDVVRRIAEPVPPEVRERGFELAWRSDIQRHKHLLTDLWQAGIDRGARA